MGFSNSLFSSLKSDLRGIETINKMDFRVGTGIGLKSDLRGIETLTMLYGMNEVT